MSVGSVFALDAPRVSLSGSRALLLEAEGPLALDTQRRIWACGREVAATGLAADIQPGMNNLLVFYDPLEVDPAALEAQLLALWDAAEPEPVNGKRLDVPVHYGGAMGQDLAEASERLSLSPRALVEMQAAAEYTMFAPGVTAGFGYLFGLPERLFLPRRDVPEPRPQAPNVVIAGLQCNLQRPRRPGAPEAAPTGWYVLGRATEVPEPFLPDRDPPAVLMPGDTVRFIPERIEA